MKTKSRFISPVLLVVALAWIPTLGCKRIATDALDRATEVAFAQASDGKMETRVGHLPDDFPPTAPLDSKADVVASCRIEADAGEKGWMAAFQTDETPAQVLAFYDSRLRRLKGDAGPEFSEMAAQLSAQGLPTESTGLETTQSFAGENTTMTSFEFGTQGTLVLKTFQRDGTTLKANEKKTLFTLMLVNAGRPQH